MVFDHDVANYPNWSFSCSENPSSYFLWVWGWGSQCQLSVKTWRNNNLRRPSFSWLLSSTVKLTVGGKETSGHKRQSYMEWEIKEVKEVVGYETTAILSTIWTINPLSNSWYTQSTEISPYLLFGGIAFFNHCTSLYLDLSALDVSGAT